MSGRGATAGEGAGLRGGLVTSSEPAVQGAGRWTGRGWGGPCVPGLMFVRVSAPAKAPSGQIKLLFFNKFSADAFGGRPWNLLNRILGWPQWPAPFRELPKPLKLISIWMGPTSGKQGAGWPSH